MDRRVFRELLSAGYGLLPGRLPGSCGYLGCEVFMAVSGGSCRNERRLYETRRDKRRHYKRRDERRDEEREETRDEARRDF